MAMPTMTDYVHIIFTLFDLFVQSNQQNCQAKQGKPYTFSEKAMIVLFTIFQFRRVFHFKAQRRWLHAHPEMLSLLGFNRVPHRTTGKCTPKPAPIFRVLVWFSRTVQTIKDSF